MRTLFSTSLALPVPLVEWLTKEAEAWGKTRNAYLIWLIERERDCKLSERVQILEKTLGRLLPTDECPVSNDEQPVNAPSLTTEKKKSAKSSRIPRTEESKRIATMFRRRLETAWSDKEIAAFKKLLPIESEDLRMVEVHYAAQWPPRVGVNNLRHDLLTFLNNFGGEVDRARSASLKPRTGNGPIPASAPRRVGPEPPEFAAWALAEYGQPVEWAKAPESVRADYRAKR